jgi:hypothetical protein
MESGSTAPDTKQSHDFFNPEILKLIEIPRFASGFQKKLRFGTSENHCRLCHAATFDIPHGGLPKKAFVLAVELAGALVSNFKGCTRGIESVHEHAVTGSVQAKLLLILKRAHRRECTEVMMES